MEDLYAPETGVLELKSHDFRLEKGKAVKVINPAFHKKRGLIVFYAPWCGHCQNMQNWLIQLAIHYQDQFPIGVVNVEDPQNAALMSRVAVQFYPTVRETTKNGTFSKRKLVADQTELAYHIESVMPISRMT